MSSIIRFSRLIRQKAPTGRDTRFTSTWRDAAGRSYGLNGPTERLIATVAQSASTYRAL